MADDDAIHDETFADAIRRRRKNLPIRLGVAVVGVLVFLPVIGPRVGLGWLTAYFLMQALEARLSAPLGAEGGRLPGWRKAATCAAILLGSLTYASFTVPLWEARRTGRPPGRPLSSSRQTSYQVCPRIANSEQAM